MKLINKDEAIWETNKSCYLCKFIDQLCNNYYEAIESNNIEVQNDILKKLNQLEINGYELLRLLESCGYICDNIDRINNVNNYIFGKNYSDEDIERLKKINPNIDINTNLFTSRWCNRCGYRKPDILENE